MRRCFLDANVVIDFMDKSATDHKEAYECLKILRLHFGKPLVSPFTFIIANYLFGKLLRDKQLHRQRMQFVFSGFLMTGVHPMFTEQVFTSDFVDPEDGAQYQCASESKAELIITKDVHDYFASAIPVIHPNDFVNRFHNLFE